MQQRSVCLGVTVTGSETMRPPGSERSFRATGGKGVVGGVSTVNTGNGIRGYNWTTELGGKWVKKSETLNPFE